MFEPVFLLTALALPQGDAPQSQPASRPALNTFSGRKPLPDVRRRLRPAKWGRGAPGQAVMRQKVMPIVDAPYTTPEKVPLSKILMVVVGKDLKTVQFPISRMILFHMARL